MISKRDPAMQLRQVKDNKGVTPLSLTVQEEKIAMISTLGKAGTDLNVLSDGKTALRRAAAAGQEDIVTALLEAGADPNVKNADEMSPLRAATGGGAFSMHGFGLPCPSFVRHISCK